VSGDAAAATTFQNEIGSFSAERPNCIVHLDENFDGISSAPLQSPAEHNVENCMVRSQSLNSPIARQQFLARLEPCMVRGESDPGSILVGGPRNKRRHSGEGGVLCHSSSSSSGDNLFQIDFSTFLASLASADQELILELYFLFLDIYLIYSIAHKPYPLQLKCLK
jgi:hypothetical protein